MWKLTNLRPIGKQHITYVWSILLSDGNMQHYRNPRLTTTFVNESDGVHGCLCAAASLCFVLAQARKLSLSASLRWAEEARKRHARNSDTDAAIIEVLGYPLCFRSLRLVVVALGRSSWRQNWATDRHDFFLRHHRRGTLSYDL